ncbi:MAG TPA: hypothetical protein VI981_00660 [Candidatus Paceibacterota bacterium]
MLARIGIPALIVLALVGGAWFRRVPRAAIKKEQNKQVEMKESQKLPTKDSSDSSLDKDIASIEAEIKLLESEDAMVDQGLGDKPISQEE